MPKAHTKYGFSKPHNLKKVYFHVHTPHRKRYEIKIVDHKLCHSEAARACQKNVKQKSNDCGTTHDDYILNNMCITIFRDLFDAAAWGEGRQSGDWNNNRWKVNDCIAVQNVQFFSVHKAPRTCNYASEVFASELCIIQMLIQSTEQEKEYREKPRFSNKSRTRLAHK